jgi:prophage regulatory protein
MSESSQPNGIQVLRMKQVCRLTGLGRSMIYQLEHDRCFPSRIKLTNHAVGWIESEVQHWLAERIASSRKCRDVRQASPGAMNQRPKREFRAAP